MEPGERHQRILEAVAVVWLVAVVVAYVWVHGHIYLKAAASVAP